MIQLFWLHEFEPSEPQFPHFTSGETPPAASASMRIPEIGRHCAAAAGPATCVGL